MRYCYRGEIIASKVIDILFAIILYLAFNMLGTYFFHKSYFGIYGLLVFVLFNIVFLLKTKTFGRYLLNISLLDYETKETLSFNKVLRKTIYDILCLLSVVFFVVDILQMYKNKDTNQTLVDQKLDIINVVAS